MRTRKRPGSKDDGETLIELIIAVAIMGITVVAIVGGFATSILMSAVHREEAAASAYLRNYAETLQGSYEPCVAGDPVPDYAALHPATEPRPIGFSDLTTEVKFWDGTSFNNISCLATDPELQQVTLTLKSADTRVSESLVVVVSKK